MIVRIRGVKKARAKGRVYYYHRATAMRIKAAPGTPAFAAEVARLDRMAAEPAVARPRDGTLGALFAAYRASPEFANLADRTRSDYTMVLDWLAPSDRLPLLQVDGAAMLKIRDRAFAKKKRRFANHLLQVLGTILAWGKPRSLSLGNPLAGMRVRIARPRDLAPANRPWKPAECEAVFAAADGGLKIAIALGMYAAMRIGDAARVTWSIYDGATLEWRQGKTGDPVWLPVHRELRALLDAAPRTATTIVTGKNGRPLTEAGVAKAFRTLILKLQKDELIGDGLTFHGLRHTNATLLADLGADPRMIQALLGHRSMAASLHYSDRADRKRAASAAIHVLEERPRNAVLENSTGRNGKPLRPKV